MAASVTIRPAVRTDVKFVVDTMVQNLKENSVYCKGIHPATMAALVDPIVATYKILVATPADDADTLLGFLVYQDAETVAFVYVRSQFRSKSQCHHQCERHGARCEAADRHDGQHEHQKPTAHRWDSGESSSRGLDLTPRRVSGGIARAMLAHAGIARGGFGTNREPAEIACPFMVTKIDGQRGKAFAALAEEKGYHLRFRPYLPLEISARVLYPNPKEVERA